ncbi:MAG: MarR family winged helix-turn-helix transcriptional regulator [Alphaproteobacteria bacterium]|nr:MarR family winged helix-turn-helix transcriptional regulator [Alphaproteobacteria bacterium]
MARKPPIFSYKKAEDSTGFLLWQVMTIWQRNLNALLKPFDLTHGQFVVMASTYWLHLHNQTVTQIDIALHAKMDPMVVSNILKILVQKKLIVRTHSSIDTRAKLVELTEKGISLLNSTVKEVENFDKKFFSKIGKDISFFNKSLQNIIEGK